MQLPLHTGRFPHVWMIAVPSVAEAIAAAYSKDKAGMIWRLIQLTKLALLLRLSAKYTRSKNTGRMADSRSSPGRGREMQTREDTEVWPPDGGYVGYSGTGISDRGLIHLFHA